MPLTNPADAGVVEAIALLAQRELSSRELVEACLARIRERDGAHSHEGDPSSINAWVRVYEDDALAAADRADAQRATGDAPVLCGVPIGLKDLYAVAGKPLTASSSLLERRARSLVRRVGATRGCRDGAARPPAHPRVRGGRDDRPGRQPVGARSLRRRFQRRLGGGARRADDARPRPARTPPAPCASRPRSAAPRRSSRPEGLCRCGGSFRWARPSTMPGRWRGALRTASLCSPRWPASAPPLQRAPLRRIAVSPRLGLVELDADVADGFDAALADCRSLGIEVVDVPAPDVELELGLAFLDLVCAEMLVYHRRFDDRPRALPAFDSRLRRLRRARCAVGGGATSPRRSGERTRPRGGSTGSPSTASMRCSSRPCRSSRVSAATATTSRSPTSPRSRSRTTGTGRASPLRRSRQVWAGAAACPWECR